MTRQFFAVNLNIHGSVKLYQSEWTLKAFWPSCIRCGQPATKEAVFKEDGCTILEKYCDGCITDPAKFEEIQKAQQWAAELFDKAAPAT